MAQRLQYNFINIHNNIQGSMSEKERPLTDQQDFFNRLAKKTMLVEFYQQYSGWLIWSISYIVHTPHQPDPTG